MLKLMGMLDILSGLTLITTILGLHHNFLFIFPVLLLLKALPFLPDIASVIDLFTVSIFIIAILGVTGFFTWIAVIWHLEKGISTLLAS